MTQFRGLVRTAPRKLATCGLALFVSCLCIAPLRAELPFTRLDRIQPLGAAAGSSVNVEVAGSDIDDLKTLYFDQPGFTVEPVKTEPVKNNVFKVTIADTVPEGTYDVRVVGRFGVSNPRLFAVSRGLEELAEVEPNDLPENAQAVPLNCVINGVSDGNGQDTFKFSAQAGQRVVLDCQSGRLDTLLDANLILSTAAGQSLASNGDYHGRDPFIDFVVPATGEYMVVMHDLSYRGGYPYRLVITNRPHIENIFPRVLKIGQPTDLVAYGRNLPGGQPSKSMIGDLPLEEQRFTITPGGDAASLARYVFSEHPSDHSIWPTAATFMLNGCQVRPPGPDGALHPSCVLLTDETSTVENEPNDDPEHAQPLTIPALVSGRFDVPRDGDWYRVQPEESGPHTIEVYSERIAGRADPYVMVIDDKKNMVVELDDFGPRSNAFDGHLRDPVGSVQLEKQRVYTILVQDRYNRGGGRYQYVLAIRRPRPDFQVAVIHSEPQQPTAVRLRRGGATHVDLVLQTQDGFNGPVTVTADELPAGVHASPCLINGNTRGVFVFWTDADAPDWTGPLKLTARGGPDDKPLTREVRPFTRVWTENSNSSRLMRQLVGSVIETAPFSLQPEIETASVVAGQKLEFKVRLTRTWPDFKAPVNVVPLGLPNGFSIASVQIAPDQSEATLTLVSQANVRPGDYTICVQGQGQVPFSKAPPPAEAKPSLVSSVARPLKVTVTAPAK